MLFGGRDLKRLVQFAAPGRGSIWRGAVRRVVATNRPWATGAPSVTIRTESSEYSATV